MVRSNKHSAYRLKTPLGEMIACFDDQSLCGLWFADQKHIDQNLLASCSWPQKQSELFLRLQNWLEDYFAGINTPITLSLNPAGTSFQKEIWTLLKTVPYAKTLTYQDLALLRDEKALENKRAAQSVAQAVSRNPISLLIPCHRIIGKDGKLKGYAGGILRKKALLELEKTGTFSFEPDN